MIRRLPQPYRKPQVPRHNHPRIKNAQEVEAYDEVTGPATMRDAEKPGRLASLASMLFAFSHRARPLPIIINHPFLTLFLRHDICGLAADE
jgi:hypothetical protein